MSGAAMRIWWDDEWSSFIRKCRDCGGAGGDWSDPCGGCGLHGYIRVPWPAIRRARRARRRALLRSNRQVHQANRFRRRHDADTVAILRLAIARAAIDEVISWGGAYLALDKATLDVEVLV